MAKVRNIKPSKIKKLSTPKRRKDIPASYFLDSKNKKYPWKNPDGSVNCRLLRGAITRAGQYGKITIQKKAQKLYEKYCKKNKNKKK